MVPTSLVTFKPVLANMVTLDGWTSVKMELTKLYTKVHEQKVAEK